MTTPLPHGWQPLPPKVVTPIGAALRAWRNEHGVSQIKLAERLDWDPSFISRIERGERSPHPDMIPVIARVTGWDPRDVALLICGFDPVAFRAEIEAATRGRIIGAVCGALEDAA